MPTGVRVKKGQAEAYDKKTGKHKAWCKTERSCKAYARIRDRAEEEKRKSS